MIWKTVPDDKCSNSECKTIANTVLEKYIYTWYPSDSVEVAIVDKMHVAYAVFIIVH